MDVKMVEKQSFAVIWKEGQGFSNEGFSWIPALWKEATNSFEEIQHLVKYDVNGNKVGFWGAMSDIEDKFEKWE